MNLIAFPVRLSHLEQRLRQSGGWNRDQALQRADLLLLLGKKFAEVDFEAVKKDVLPFLRDPASVQLWSRQFFESLLPRLKAV